MAPSPSTSPPPSSPAPPRPSLVYGSATHTDRPRAPSESGTMRSGRRGCVGCCCGSSAASGAGGGGGEAGRCPCCRRTSLVTSASVRRRPPPHSPCGGGSGGGGWCITKRKGEKWESRVTVSVAYADRKNRHASTASVRLSPPPYRVRVEALPVVDQEGGAQVGRQAAPRRELPLCDMVWFVGGRWFVGFFGVHLCMTRAVPRFFSCYSIITSLHTIHA